MSPHAHHHAHHHGRGKPESQGVGALGDGYNSFHQSAMPSHVDNGNINTIAVSSQANIYVCTSTEQMFRALDINAAMGASTSWGSFQARVDFVHTVQSTTSSVVILVVAEKIESGGNMSTASFTIPPTSAIDLYRHGGDSYVSSISLGGMYMAAYTFQSYDENSYDSVVAAADVEFSSWGADFDAHFGAKIEDIKTKSQVNWSFKQHKIGFTAPTPTTDDIVDFVLKFDQLTMDQPGVFEFSTQSYSTLEGCPTDFDTVDDYRLQWDGNNDIDPQQCLSTVMAEAQSNRKIIQGTKELYDFYGCLGVEPKLDSIDQKLRDLLHQIAQWRAAVDKTPTTAGIIAPTYSDDDLKFPVAKWGLDSSGGGPTNGYWYFSDINIDMVPRLVRPVSIEVKSGDSVDHIKTNYFISNGDNHDYSQEHGGGGGDQTDSMAFGPGDVITSIAPGWWNGDDTVKSIKITTTTQPDGKIMGRHTPDIWGTWTKADDTCLVGFSGFNDDYMRSLQAQYVKFLPCVWKNPSDPLGSGRDRRGRKRDPQTVVDVRRWLLGYLSDASKWAQIQYIYGQKGGWEGWLQVELAHKWQAEYGYGWLVERERNVYTPETKRRADLTITKKGEVSYVIELKVDGFYRDSENTASLFYGVAEDIEKIMTNSFTSDLGHVVAYVFGVCVVSDIAAVGELFRWATAYGAPSYTRVRGTKNGAFELYLWSWRWQNFKDPGPPGDENGTGENGTGENGTDTNGTNMHQNGGKLEL